MKIIIPLILLLLLSCTDKNDGSHLPLPLELPSAIIGTTVDNAIYGHKRTKVKHYVIENYDSLKVEIKAGDGVHFNALLDKADIQTLQRNRVKQELSQEYDSLFKNTQLSTEAVMNTFSALYLPKEGTKTINGFTYTQAYNIVQAYLENHFDIFRLSLKNKITQGLITLINDLNIDDKNKQNLFYESLWKRYDTLIIEPVVVAVMVKTN